MLLDTHEQEQMRCICAIRDLNHVITLLYYCYSHERMRLIEKFEFEHDES